MDLPNFRRGFELVSAELNKLANNIRSSTITSVIGGTFSRTPGGTTLIINQQPAGPGAGSDAICPFALSNASTVDQVLVNIKYGQVAGREPDGMTPDAPYNLTITETSYIYCVVLWNTDTMTINPASSSISFEASSTLEANTTDTQYILAGTVTVVDGEITKTNSVCAQIVPDPCLLDWSVV